MDAAHEALRAGLDVFAVTNHNQVVAARLAQWVSAFSAWPIMIPGQEITTPRCHLIAVGVERRIDPDQPAWLGVMGLQVLGPAQRKRPVA